MARTTDKEVKSAKTRTSKKAASKCTPLVGLGVRDRHSAEQIVEQPELDVIAQLASGSLYDLFREILQLRELTLQDDNEDKNLLLFIGTILLLLQRIAEENDAQSKLQLTLQDIINASSEVHETIVEATKKMSHIVGIIMELSRILLHLVDVLLTLYKKYVRAVVYKD